MWQWNWLRAPFSPIRHIYGMRFDEHRPWKPETLLLLASLIMLLAGNRNFLSQALSGSPVSEASTWLFGGALVVCLLATNYLVLGMLAWGRLLKPLVAVVLLLTASTAHFIDSFGTLVDPAMLRNVLNTHWSESKELIGPRLGLALLLGALLPAALIWRLPMLRRSWGRALAFRLGTLALALLIALGSIWIVFQPLSSLMRSQRDLRYMVTPVNVLWSSSVLAHRASQKPPGPRAEVGRDAVAGPSLMQAQRPRVVVLVVGETARAANWGLNGYARQTTPLLAQLPVISFLDVTSCGTDTETSLPCMFAATGRRDYDEQRIRHSENLLHVLSRAGVAVHWRDNQSGCKGICKDFSQEMVATLAPPEFCKTGNCMDEGLLHKLDDLLPAQGLPPGPGQAKLIVLHQLGNHGPAYYRRVPAAFKRFMPACEKDDLRLCDAASIVNAYDNALLYTDHVLATLIQRLQARSKEVDSAVIYVSDHGESLGEHGLFLHGMPFALAPDVQKRVPMFMWVSDGFAAARGLDMACLTKRAASGGPVSHDHLFHTTLGLFDVATRAREPAWDLAGACTPAPANGPVRAAP